MPPVPPSASASDRARPCGLISQASAPAETAAALDRICVVAVRSSETENMTPPHPSRDSLPEAAGPVRPVPYVNIPLIVACRRDHSPACCSAPFGRCSRFMSRIPTMNPRLYSPTSVMSGNMGLETRLNQLDRQTERGT